MDYFFEHHSATLVFFVHQGGGTLETTFGPIEFRKGDFLIVPKGITHRFELAAGPQYYWVSESFAAGPEKAESPTTGQSITHSRSDYKYPRTLDTRNEAGRFEIVSKVADVYTRRVHPTHPFDVVGWRGDYLPYRFAVEDVRPLVADRSHVPPSGHTIFKLPGCYICTFTVRSVEKEGMWLPFFHKNLDYLETLGYHFGDFFSGGGVVREGMVTLHPVGLPHGPKPASLKAFLDGKNPGVHNEVGIMADLANPTEISEFALSLSTPDYMAAWSAYTTDPRFVHRPDMLAGVPAPAPAHERRLPRSARSHAHPKALRPGVHAEGAGGARAARRPVRGRAPRPRRGPGRDGRGGRLRRRASRPADRRHARRAAGGARAAARLVAGDPRRARAGARPGAPRGGQPRRGGVQGLPPPADRRPAAPTVHRPR